MTEWIESRSGLCPSTIVRLSPKALILRRPQLLDRLNVERAGRGKIVVALKFLERFDGSRSEHAVDGPELVAELVQAFLQLERCHVLVDCRRRLGLLRA